MIVVSNDFKAAMKQPVKELQAFIDAGDIDPINDSGDLISFKVSCDSGLCKSAMRKLEAKYLGDHNLVGKWVTAGFGVKLASGTYETLNYGSFLVSEQTVTKDTGVTNIVAYDKMINAMDPYNAELFKDLYPLDLYSYTAELCKACGLELYNDGFPANGDWVIDRELWENINGITYRDIFVQIAEATATTCIIHDDKVYFRDHAGGYEVLTYDNLLKLKLEPLYGEINSVVLSREPLVGEDVFCRDEISIATNGLTEFRIENNEILDKDRENGIVPIYDELFGLEFYPFEATTEGLGWFEIGDMLIIKNNTDETYQTNLFNYSVTIDGGIKETLKTTVESKAQTQYQYAKSIAKRVKNAEIIVNKQEQYIQSVVSDMEDANENYTKIYQDIEGIVQSVQKSGGSNLLKNSVMFAYDSDNKPNDWKVIGMSLTIQADADALASGGISGHSFTLTGGNAVQKVGVKVNTEDDPAEYSFSVRVKKGAVGTCSIIIYNDVERYQETVAEGESPHYKEYTITGLKPQMNYYHVQLYVSGGASATFTDCMFSAGDRASKWTQANGEVMNTQVNVSVDGVVVKSSVYQGNYTVMSPLEFAGYSVVNGTPTRVFYLNKDVTKVQKLEAVDEIKMGTIKIVPINNSSMQGWAFVPST